MSQYSIEIPADFLLRQSFETIGSVIAVAWCAVQARGARWAVVGATAALIYAVITATYLAVYANLRWGGASASAGTWVFDGWTGSALAWSRLVALLAFGVAVTAGRSVAEKER